MTMIKKNLVRWLGCASLALIGSLGSALTELAPAMSLQQMTQDADEIVMGNVLGKSTKVVKNVFETEFQIQVFENMKSTSGRMAPGQTITLTLPGGVLQSPPLTQYAMGQPTFYKGQEVALFLKAPVMQAAPNQTRNAGPQSTLRSSYKILGMNQGSFSVITRKDTGEKVVARISLEDYGFVNSSEGVKEIEKSVADNLVPTVEGSVVRTNDYANSVKAKDPLELTNGDKEKLKIETAMQGAELRKELQKREAISIQKLDSFKGQISQFVNQSK